MRMILIALAAILLPACTMTAPQTLPPPVQVADMTIADEKAGLAIELAYQAAATAALTADRAGIVPDTMRPRIAAANRRAIAAVGAVRAAYDASNAASYAEALPKAREAVAALLSSIGSN